MNAMTDNVATEVSHIHQSLDALLAAIIEIDRHPNRRRTGRAYSAAEATAEFMAWLDMTKHQQFAHDIAREPVREALCYAIHELGERLNEIGGLRAMHDAMRFVEDADRANWDHRISVLDKRWDGIGDWCA